MLSNFMITLIAMFAIIFSLFKTEIKENFTNPLTAGHPNGLTRNGFSVWSGSGGGQFKRVGANPKFRRGNHLQDDVDYNLGYKMNQRFPKEQTMEKHPFSSGVDSTRNIQTAPPPRFMVTGPKLNHYTPIDMATHAVNTDSPIDHDTDLVVSPFGQMHRDSRHMETKENYSDYASASVPLPKDMTNVNMLGTESQPVIYDRVMYSNIRSRLRGQGDYIRGDLMIAPDNYKPGSGGHPQWFQVSVKPERDLNPGAMEHLFGRSEELSLGLANADVDVASFGL
jgi:hypothetical protein